MTNGEKYKTTKERAEAFAAYAKSLTPSNEYEFGVWAFEWLELDAESAVLPCPFCGGLKDGNRLITNVEVKEESRSTDGTLGPSSVFSLYHVECPDCGYRSEKRPDREEAIAEHNRVVKAVMESSDEQ